MSTKNEMKLHISAVSQNEAFARTAVAAFVTPLNPTVSEINEIKTAVSEAVTNSIIHGYENMGDDDFVLLYCKITDRDVYIEVIDEGVGIADIEKAMEPLYTSKPELMRSGMGFTFMESFMDDVSVTSEPGKGTKVAMRKALKI